MTVKGTKAVVAGWRKRYYNPERAGKMSIEILWSSTLEALAAADALHDCLERAAERYEETHTQPIPLHGEPPHIGEWHITIVPEGVLLVGGRKSDDGEGDLLKLLANEMDARGLSGKLSPYVSPEVPDPPSRLAVIEATLRLSGQRVAGRTPAAWRVDRAALDRVLEAAIDWTLQARPDQAVSLHSGPTPPQLIRRCDHPWSRVRDVLDREYRTKLRSIGDGRYRSVSAMPGDAEVTVLEAGPYLERVGWQPTITAITDLLTKVHADLVYARVRLVSTLNEAEYQQSQPERLSKSGMLSYAYDSQLAPDAYGLQLLGPGYPSNFYAGPDWTATKLGEQHTLLAHNDPRAWFAEPTLVEAMHGVNSPRQDLLASAQADLAPILFPAFRFTELDQVAAEIPTVLPQRIADRALAAAGSDSPEVVTVQLMMSDGRVLKDVDLTRSGAVIARVGQATEFSIDIHQVVDAVR